MNYQLKLSNKILACYAGISMPMAALVTPVSVYLPPLYSEGLGLDLATIGLVFMLARVWDVVTDPIMGVIVDRFDTRWGRRKHWIAIAVPILMVSVWMIFMPAVDQASTSYLAVWLIIMYLGFTMLAIAHQSWGAELATSYDDRTRLFTWREVFLLGGAVLALALPALLDLTGNGSPAARVASMGWFCIVMFPATAWFTLRFVPDRGARTKMTVDWREAISILVRNTLMWRILAADFSTGLATTSGGALYIFLITYVFELPEQASIALLSIFFLGVCAMPLWLKIAVILGKDLTIRVALTLVMAVHVLLYFSAGAGADVALWAYSLVYGFLFGAAPTLIRSMMADVTDLDELETGTKRAGLFFALMTTSGKLGSAVAVGLAFAIVEGVFGFQPGQNVNQDARNGLLLTYCGLACVANGLAWVMFVRYPLDKQRHQEIETALLSRAGAGTPANLRGSDAG